MIKHLYEFDQDREMQVIRRLFLEGAPGTTMQMLGIHTWHWLGVGIPSHRLGWPRDEKPGDIDLCGGALVPVSEDAVVSALAKAAEIQAEVSGDPLHPSLEAVRAEDPEEWERRRESSRQNVAGYVLLSRGDLKPLLEPTFAFEVKVTRFSANGVLRAAKTGGHPQKMARKQARGLAEMGFDHVGLLRVLVTEPCLHPVGSAWLHAGSHASTGVREYEDAIVAFDDDPFRTLVASVGAVAGRLESEAGSMGVNMSPIGQWNNPLINAEAADMRETLQGHLSAVLRNVPGPRRTPMLVLACADDACGRLFVPSDEVVERWEAPCPDCGGSTTVGGRTRESPR